jgi:ERCC4-related helicase
MPLKSPDYINHPLLKKDKLVKRRYQQNLFIKSTKSNCLVVIPTGLGKTIVALLLCLHRLKDSNTNIIFLAPTRPLVEQHKRTFEDLTLLDKENLIMMTGSIAPEKRAILYKSAQCLFMTPQILQNDLIANRFNLADTTLLIFDEAHRATGNYAYTFLAKKYLKQAKSPKILAITASPGKNRDKIEEVMENLYLDAIEIRTESDADVKPYIQDVETIWEDVELPDDLKEILAIINKLLKSFNKEMKDNDILDVSNINQVNRKDILVAGKKLDQLIIKAQTSGDLPRLLYFKKKLSNAIRLSHMGELIEAQGIFALNEFIQKNLDEISKGKAGKSTRELFELPEMDEVIIKITNLMKNNIDHPKMAKLMILLTEQFESNPESRILVFCHYRDSVRIIVKEINKHELIEAKQFIGQQTKGKRKGLSQKDQLNLLQAFKNGELNTLVATSVAEEGLDISECDVVVFYDVVPSEIRSIQRRGRTGRNRSGKVIILKTKGTREEGYFWAEKHREREMKRVLKEIQKELSTGDSNSGENANLQKGQKSLASFMKKNTTEKPEEITGIVHKFNSEETRDTFDITDKEGPLIMVDSRETASPVSRILSEHEVNIKLQKLPTGDYILSERCGVERKSIPDFVSSIKDGRLFNELKRLKNQFTIAILILEGELKSAATMNRAALLGTLTSVMLRMQIFLYQTATPEETAEILIALAKKEQSDPSKKKFSIRFKKAPEKIEDQLEFIVSGIPGINVSRARDLLEKFDTLETLFTVNEEELKKTANIGTVLAKNIRKYATSRYSLSFDEKDTK